MKGVLVPWLIRRMSNALISELTASLVSPSNLQHNNYAFLSAEAQNMMVTDAKLLHSDSD